MKKLLLILLCGFIFLGCSRLKGRVVNNEGGLKDKATISEEKNSTYHSIGIELLVDRRPDQDVAYMASVREKVSDQVYQTLKATGMFKDINYPAAENDRFVVKGEIRKFSSRSFDTMISYIPLLNVFNIFGAPSTRTQAEADIYVEIVDKKTNKIIYKIHEDQTKKSRYNIYNYTPTKANNDLAFCFNSVIRRVKTQLLLNKKIILDALVIEEPEVSKSDTKIQKLEQNKIKKVAEKAQVAEQKAKEVEEKIKEMEEKMKKMEEMVKDTETRVEVVEKKALTETKKIEENGDNISQDQ